MNINKDEATPCCCSCRRFAMEWKVGVFSVEDFNGRTIDIKRTFAPGPVWLTSLWRIGILVWLIATVAYNIEEYDVEIQAEKLFWFAYYTNLSVIPSFIYFLMALIASIQITRSADTQELTWSTKATWILFPTSAALQLTATILFWVLVYTPDRGILYTDLVKHGILLIVILIDGFIVNKIPVRFKAILPLLLFNVTYIGWSLVQAFLNIGNPISYDNDPETDDDAVYATLNWNKRPGVAAVLTLITNVFVFPYFFFIIWNLSSLGRGFSCIRFDGSGRRYLPAKPSATATTNNHDENVDEELSQNIMAVVS